VDDIAIMRLNNRDVIRHKLVRDIVAAFEKAEKASQEKKERKGRKMYDHSDRK
jgi:phosphate starvation-inducible PhoH-like protein